MLAILYKIGSDVNEFIIYHRTHLSTDNVQMIIDGSTDIQHLNNGYFPELQNLAPSSILACDPILMNSVRRT